ncbi:hypothetical protein, partial [Leyella stercorea]|uniref:hypothetical protein n=1 Tax=Leyella stercorea TaxID=363265 RepID=UPI002670A0E8
MASLPQSKGTRGRDEAIHRRAEEVEFCHPHRSLRTSASTVTSIRIDRYEHPHRPLRASAPTVTSIRTDRYEHLHRPLRASAPTVTSIRTGR